MNHDIAFQVGIALLITIPLLLAISVPISITIGLASMIALLTLIPFDQAVLTSAQRAFNGINSFTLLAIPFFILAGNIMNKGGIAIRLVNCAKVLSGKMPGALAQSNIVANMLFGAISGSAVAAAAAVGSTMTPLEEKEGYDKGFSAAVNIASAPSGILIPPSNTLIVFSLASGGTSVAALFMGGYLPGILWGLACLVVSVYYSYQYGYHRKSVVTFKQGLYTFYEAIPSLALIIIVIGGIVAGIFTATEGSAVAVIYSLILSFFYRMIKIRDIPNIILEAAKTTSIVVFMIGTSTILSWLMAYAKIPDIIANSLISLTNNKIVILLIMNFMLLIVGTFMDATPAVLIFTPILLPIAQQFGMHPVHFGLMIVTNLSIGTITPPVGPVLFVGSRVANLKIEQVIKPLIPFFVACVFVLMLVTFIPALSLAIPTALGFIK